MLRTALAPAIKKAGDTKAAMRHNDHLPRPEVSVITPLYNSSASIERTLDALRAQTFDGWESLLIDDGSTDDTAEKIKPYLQDRRFTYVRQENSGVASARNAGIRRARGAWVCLLDHDDRWMSAKLEKQLAFAAANNCDIVCTDAVVVQEHSRKLYSQFYSAEFIAKLKQLNADASADAFELLIQHNFLCASSVMLRKALFDQVGLLDPDAAPADDYDMWLRCLPAARIGYLAEPLIEYSIHAGNFSHNFITMVEKIIHVLHRAAEAHGDDSRRLKQLGDSLILNYRLLLTELLEKRQYGAALRHTAAILARGQRGWRWFYWTAERNLLVAFCKSFAGRTATRRSVFGEYQLETTGRRATASDDDATWRRES